MHTHHGYVCYIILEAKVIGPLREFIECWIAISKYHDVYLTDCVLGNVERLRNTVWHVCAVTVQYDRSVCDCFVLKRRQSFD